MAEYDLSSKIGGYLDRHLVLPMLEFLSEKDIYDEKDMLKARIELLIKTNMVDYAVDVYQQLHPDGSPPDELVARRSGVVEQLEEFEHTIDPVLTLFGNPEVAEHIDKGKEDQSTLYEYLVDNHDLKPEMVDLVYDCAKFKYECGNYTDASEYLYFYKVLAPPDHKNILSASWGKLSCAILNQEWDTSLEELHKLRREIDEAHVPNLMRLQQRTWLIHWSLFVFFNHPKGQDDIINLFLYQQDYLNAIQTCCPHILRYVTAAVITNKRRQTLLKDLVRVIKHESYFHRDPITEFVECLYVNFDFDQAQQKLQECEKVLDHDFFLVDCRADFIENARLSIFETFCRIHQCISIKMLASKLNMSSDDAERWIVNLIRNAKLDAKIDAMEGHVIMNTQPPSLYQRVIDKTKALAFQSQFIAQNIEKKVQAAQVAAAATAAAPTAQQGAAMTAPPVVKKVQHWGVAS